MRRKETIGLLLILEQTLLREGLASLFWVRGGFEVAAIEPENGLRLAARFRPAVAVLDAELAGQATPPLAQGLLALSPPPRLFFLDEYASASGRECARANRASGYGDRRMNFNTIALALQRVASGHESFTAPPRALPRPGQAKKTTWAPFATNANPSAAERLGTAETLPARRESAMTAPSADQSLDPPGKPGAPSSIPAPHRVDAPEWFTNLTPREREVFAGLAKGQNGKQIAEGLGLSPNTVDNHKTSLMRKLRLHRTVELVLLATREKLFGE